MGHCADCRTASADRPSNEGRPKATARVAKQTPCGGVVTAAKLTCGRPWSRNLGLGTKGVAESKRPPNLSRWFAPPWVTKAATATHDHIRHKAGPVAGALCIAVWCRAAARLVLARRALRLGAAGGENRYTFDWRNRTYFGDYFQNTLPTEEYLSFCSRARRRIVLCSYRGRGGAAPTVRIMCALCSWLIRSLYPRASSQVIECSKTHFVRIRATKSDHGTGGWKTKAAAAALSPARLASLLHLRARGVKAMGAAGWHAMGGRSAGAST